MYRIYVFFPGKGFGFIEHPDYPDGLYFHVTTLTPQPEFGCDLRNLHLDEIRIGPNLKHQGKMQVTAAKLIGQPPKGQRCFEPEPNQDLTRPDRRQQVRTPTRPPSQEEPYRSRLIEEPPVHVSQAPQSKAPTTPSAAFTLQPLRNAITAFEADPTETKAEALKDIRQKKARKGKGEEWEKLSMQAMRLYIPFFVKISLESGDMERAMKYYRGGLSVGIEFEPEVAKKLQGEIKGD